MNTLAWRFLRPNSVASRKSLPFLLVLFIPLVLIWAAVILLRQPYSGLIWSFTTGIVSDIDPQGPAANLFQAGDRILSIDGVDVYQARDFPAREAGTLAILSIERDTNLIEVTLRLDRPPLLTIFKRLSTLLVAFSFWMPGALILAFGRPGRLSVMFFVLCQLFALALGLGSISAHGPLWAGWAFNVLLWWIGPVTLHTHLLLGGYIRVNKRMRPFIFLYVLAFLFSLLELWRLNLAAPGPLLAVKYIWLGLTLVAAAGVLVVASRDGETIEFRRRTRIAGLGALIAFLPFVLLSLMPDALTGQYLLPYEVTFLFLPALPLGYGYAILRYRLIRIERYVNRSAAYVLVALAVGSFYGLAYLLVPNLLPAKSTSVPAGGFVVALILILAVHPLYKFLQRWVDSLFYGGWYDDRRAAKQISRAIKQVKGDTYSIAQTLCQALQKTMQLEYANLLLGDGCLVSTRPAIAKDIFLLNESALAQGFEILSSTTGREAGPAAELDDVFPLSEGETDRLLGPKPLFWLLLNGKRSPQGLLILGSRRGGGEFSPQDLEILEVVIRQAGAALENAFLLEEIRRYSNQIKNMHRQIQATREEERKRLARDLHDRSIQALVGINYQLDQVRARTNSRTTSELVYVQTQLRTVLSELRQVCAGLRPPGLDSLGLVALLQSRAEELNVLAPFAVQLKIDDQSRGDLPEGVSLCLYRCFKELVFNVQKHAQARIVQVYLQVIPGEEAILSVEDDGQGFETAPHLGILAEQHHFGLIGMQEQVEALGGQLLISSKPGIGCKVRARIPLPIEIPKKTLISRTHE